MSGIDRAALSAARDAGREAWEQVRLLLIRCEYFVKEAAASGDEEAEELVAELAKAWERLRLENQWGRAVLAEQEGANDA